MGIITEAGQALIDASVSVCPVCGVNEPRPNPPLPHTLRGRETGTQPPPETSQP